MRIFRDEEQGVKNLGYLFAAYSVIWTALFVYTVRLSRKNRELAQELQLLQAQVAKALAK